MKKRIWLRGPKHLLAAVVVIAMTVAAVGTVNPHPAKAAATNWQLPCFPYENPYYAFGQFVSGWGYHVGEDVCKGAGLPIYAAAEGRVVYSARTPDSYRWGNLIIIEHTNADGSVVNSVYGHLGDNRQVGAGAVVGKGHLLGFVGPDYSAQNGNWGAHLHFGIRGGPYGAPVGTYASWVHGYENSFPAGWTNPGDYIRSRLAAYDHVAVGAPPASMSFTGEQSVRIQVRNSGGATWRKDGNSDNPVRLGTTLPRDRGSGFAQNGAGWIGTNRIKLDNDTGPQGLATFTATFKSPGIAGRYNECFTPVVEGVGWMAERPVCVSVEVRPPEYRAEYAGQLVSTNQDPANLSGGADANYLLPGQKRNFKVMLKNVGELPWDVGGANPVRLGASNPRDRGSGLATIGDGSVPASNNWLSTSRASGIDGRLSSGSVVADDQITTGETAVFSYTATAPDVAASFREYFQPVAEGRSWMNELGIYFPIRVLAPGYHYEYVSQGAVAPVGLNETTRTTTFQIRNTGRTPWTVGGGGANPVRLATDQPLNGNSPFATPPSASDPDTWLSANRLSAIDRNVTSAGKNTIDPGETAEFKMQLTVPASTPAGTHRLYVRPVAEGVAYFPEYYGAYFPVTVTAKPYDYQLLKQEFSSNYNNAVRGSQITTGFAIKNTGRTSWPVGGANPVRFGTSRPQDRGSGFADLDPTHPDRWLAPTRASGIKGRVTDLATLATTPATEIQPGETALFRMTLQVPANIPNGLYPEFFNVLQEGVGWLPDLGINVPITVR